MSYLFQWMQKAVLIVKTAGLVPRSIKNDQRILDICGTMTMLARQKTLEIFRFRTGPHQQSVWLRYNWLQHRESNRDIHTCSNIIWHIHCKCSRERATAGRSTCLPAKCNSWVCFNFNIFVRTKWTEIIVTRHVHGLKIYLNVLAAGDATGGAYSAPPDHLAGFKGAALWQRGKGRVDRGEKKAREEKENEGRKERKRRGRGWTCRNSCGHPCTRDIHNNNNNNNRISIPPLVVTSEAVKCTKIKRHIHCSSITLQSRHTCTFDFCLTCQLLNRTCKSIISMEFSNCGALWQQHAAHCRPSTKDLIMDTIGNYCSIIFKRFTLL